MIKISGFGKLIERDLLIHQPKCGCKFRLSVCRSMNNERDMLKVYCKKKCNAHRGGGKMNEPLTRKFMGKTIHPDFTVTDDSIYRLESDVKSAVEWLKEQISKVAPRHKADFTSIKEMRKSNWQLCNCKVCSRIAQIKLKVDEAFPDLCPSGDLIANKQNPQSEQKLRDEHSRNNKILEE